MAGTNIAGKGVKERAILIVNEWLVDFVLPDDASSSL